MSERDRVLGICLAKMQDRVRTEYLNAINRAAALAGWKTVAYNSFRDFRKNDLCVQGSKSIFNIVNYEDIDVLVTFPESMNRSEISDALIEYAKKKGKPVICIGPEKEGCFSVVRDYDNGFKKLLSHVIEVHNAKDTFFVGGFREDDERTRRRMECYREVLEEHGLNFETSNVAYGDYKSEVTDEVIDGIMLHRKVPKAFFCVDDNTAIRVCEKLSEYDIKVPDDVIVTGFGGVPAAYYYHPSISSCSDDVDAFAKLVMKAAEDAYNGLEPKVYKNPFKERIRRSCGCDMRSYLSAGRREYDLAAAKAAGMVVLKENEQNKTEFIKYTEENGGNSEKQDQNASGTGTTETDKPGNKTLSENIPGLQDDSSQDETVFMPNASESGTVMLLRKNPEPDENEPAKEDSGNIAEDGTVFPKEIRFGIKPEEIPDYSQDRLKDIVESDPRFSDTHKGGYDISYGQGRTETAGEAKSGGAEAKPFEVKPLGPVLVRNVPEEEKPKASDSEELEKAAKRAMDVAEDKRVVGGHGEAKFRSGNHVAYIYKELDEIERREDSTLAWIDRMLELSETEDVCNSISKRLPEGASVYVFKSLLESGFDIDNFESADLNEEELTVIEADPSKGADKFSDFTERPVVRVKDILKKHIASPHDGMMFVLNPIFIGNFVCGYCAVRTTRLSDIRSSTKLLCTGLNLTFRFMANQNRQQQMLYNIENSTFVSSMTGLPNLKGLTRWFEGFSAIDENHEKTLNISVFSMPRYTYIYENYGLNEIEDSVRFIVEKVRSVSRKGSFIGQFAEGEFVVIDSLESYDEKQTDIETIFGRFDKIMEEHNRKSTKEYFLEVNYGTAVLETGWDSTLESMVRMAVSDMYLRRLRKGNVPVIREKTFDREYFTTFELLVDRNLFRYHFQPIVDAGTGKIVAYEALMRTGGGISMSPLDVLDIAKDAQRLYDIEKATLFNVLKFYEDHLEEFGDKKVFINTIPGHYLNHEDKSELEKRFGKYIDSVVFEVTEGNTMSDEELASLRTPITNGKRPHVAVDDYGTGHSNIVNLLRYEPQYIKIDRYLISNIQDDSNKQMFVKNTIEFAALNGIKVLAEGVETSEELKKVIEYGVDYIQGYYTARPSPELTQQIPQNIRSEILNESIKAARFDNDNLVYNAKAGETVNLLELALKKYTTIMIAGGKVKLVGEPENIIDMVIKTADNRKTDLIIENVNLRGVLETTVQLGRNSETALYIQGECTLNKDGISVPLGSRLVCSGPGNLHIITSRNLSIGIGSNCNEPHGDLSFDMTGSIKIVANGDKVAGIGGGRCDGSRIRLINGTFDISAKAIHAVAIGSDVGDTDIYIGRGVVCKLKSDGNESIALGSINGKSEIVCRGKLEITGDGEKTVGVGSIYGFTKADILNNDVSVVLHSYCGIGIGSLSGGAEIQLEEENVNVYAEGTQINGIGSGEDVANTEIKGGDVKVEILAGIPRSLGIQMGRTVLRYGIFTSMQDAGTVVLDEYGKKLTPKLIENGVVYEI